MNRRHFLSTSLLSGAAVAAAVPARAFEVKSCADTPGTLACTELARHHEILAQMDSMLRSKGMDESHRRAALAAAICPFCGEPLIG